jgi:GNAT superfamily N-acetyltransferase
VSPRARIRLTDDEDAVDTLDRECFAEGDAYPIKFDASLEMWLATLGGEPAGYAVASMKTPDVAHFDRYGVTESARGHGLGKRLIRVASNWARSHGAFYIHTYTHPSNAASINALIACGYRAWQPMPSEYGYENTPETEARMGAWCYWRKDLGT